MYVHTIDIIRPVMGFGRVYRPVGTASREIEQFPVTKTALYMTTNEDDIICHSQVTRREGISVNLTEIERFLVTLASILRTRPGTD